MPRLRDEGPLALSGPLSAPPGSSPLSPSKADLELRAASARVTRPVAPTPATAAPTALDLPLAVFPTAPGPASNPSARPFVMVALLLGLLLPTATHAPWALLDRPSGPTALALAGLLLMGLDAHSAGPPHLMRWGLRLISAVTLAALSALALSDTLAMAPWGESLGPAHGALLVLGFALLVGGSLTPAPTTAARVAALAGGLLLLLAALIPGPGGIPIVRVAGATAAPKSADSAAALATLVFAVLAIATTVSAGLNRRSPSWTRRLAVTVWLFAPAPLLLHVVLSTPPEAWMLALAPFKATVVLAGALLLCADAIAPALEPERQLVEHVAF